MMSKKNILADILTQALQEEDWETLGEIAINIALEQGIKPPTFSDLLCFLREVVTKAELVDYINELDNIHDGEPVTVKGWGDDVGFNSAKDFAFVRLMTQLERASKDATVARWRLRELEKLIDTDDREIRAILDKPDSEIIRETIYGDRGEG